MRQRLNAYVAQATGCSRRQADVLIETGKVKVNGQKVALGTTVDTEADAVTVEGKPAKPAEFVYVALNKPAGYLTTRADTHARQTIYDLLPPELHALKPVGRLDTDSEGLLLLTNDGQWALRLTHPRYGHEREYELELDRPVSGDLLRQWRRGVRLPEGLAQADAVEQVGEREIRAVLHQGWKRQLRRMAGASGAGIVRLVRVRIGSLELGKLGVGKWRRLTAGEVESLRGENK